MQIMIVFISSAVYCFDESVSPLQIWITPGKGHPSMDDDVRCHARYEGAAHYVADEDLVKSGFGGEHTDSNHRLMYA
jgi:hypothetical protein